MLFARLRFVLVLSLVGLIGAGCVNSSQKMAQISEISSLQYKLDDVARAIRISQQIWHDFMAENPSLFKDKAITSAYTDSFQRIIDKTVQYAEWQRAFSPDNESRLVRLRADVRQSYALIREADALGANLPAEIQKRFAAYFAKRDQASHGQAQTASTSQAQVATPQVQPEAIQAAKGWYETVNDGQYLFSKADAKSSPLGQIGSGIRVKVTDAKGSWAKVTTPFGTSGWIPLSALKKVSPTTAP
jgi:Bacterial SH3 domain